jgi:putative copper export protein
LDILVVVEIVLIAIACAGTGIALGRFRELRRAGATLGVLLVLAGLWIGILLYCVDLSVVKSRPDAEALANALMAAAPLGSELSWYVIAASVLLVMSGLVVTVLQMVRQTYFSTRNARPSRTAKAFFIRFSRMCPSPC